jgi:malonate transporter and related proteins
MQGFGAKMLDVLLAIFIPIGIGFAAGKLNFLSTEHNAIFSKFAFYVSFPCMLLALFGSQNVLSDLTPALLALNLAPFMLLIALFTIAGIALKLEPVLVSTLMLASIMPNTAFVGFPVSQVVLGSEGAKYALLIGPLQLVLLVLFAMPAISFLTKKSGSILSAFKELSTNPIVYAMIFGIAMNAFGVQFPSNIEAPLQAIGASTIPIALFSLGLFISGIAVNAKKIKDAVLVSIFRLAPYPFLVWAMAPILGVSGMPFKASLLLSFMPVAVISYVVSMEKKIDSEAISLGVLFTTLLLPLTIYLAKLLF